MNSSLPIPVLPFYSMEKIDQAILLYEGSMDVITQAFSAKGYTVIEQQWLPEPSIRLKCRHDKPEMPQHPKAQMGFPGGPWRFEVLLTSMGIGVESGESYGVLSGLPQGMAWGSSDDLSSVIFHVPNFSWFNGTQFVEEETGDTRARANLMVDEWAIALDSVANYDLQGEDELEQLSGNAITHVGKITRPDFSLFNVSDAFEILEVLYKWLSFCRGTWVAPILSVGYDSNGAPAWKDWRQWNFRRCESVPTWINRQSSVSLEKSFPGVYARYKNGTWAEPIKLAIAWYVECNRRASGLEASIILGQTGLELLAWTLLVDENQVISSRGFDDLPASDKIRLLLSTCRIPLSVPNYLTDLGKLAKEFSWSDGPECLVGTRNALVHPRPKNRAKIGKATSLAIYETWNLGLWYFELVLLKLFNYEGKYHNRLRRDCTYNETLEDVPWA